MRQTTILLLLLSTAPAGSLLAAPILPGQQDTFDTDSENWFFGGGPGGVPSMPAAFVAGGPGGAGDGYMLLQSTGIPGGPNSRLSISNAEQWAGDYRAEDIVALSMWVNNFGQEDLALRLAFEVLGVMGPTDIAFSAHPIFVPAGSGWREVIFPIRDGDLLNVGLVPGSSIEDVLTSTSLLRLYHSPADNVPNPVNPIPFVSAELGVDEITALADVFQIAEPSTLLLFVAGLASAISRRHRRAML